MFSWADETKHTAMQFVTINLGTQENIRTRNASLSEENTSNTPSERSSLSDGYDKNRSNTDLISFFEAIKDHYVIVLIYNDQYYGSAYVCITETKRCLIHDVYCRVDEEDIPCLREGFLEECLRFAREKECNRLTVAKSEAKVKEAAMTIGGKKDRLHMQEMKGCTLYPEGSQVFDRIYKDLEINAITIAL